MARHSNIRASPGHCDQGRTINLEMNEVDAEKIDAEAPHPDAVRRKERKKYNG